MCFGQSEGSEVRKFTKLSSFQAITASASVFKSKLNMFWILWSRKYFFLDNENDHFQGDLTDISAKKEPYITALATLQVDEHGVGSATSVSTIEIYLYSLRVWCNHLANLQRVDFNTKSFTGSKHQTREKFHLHKMTHCRQPVNIYFPAIHGHLWTFSFV